MKTGVSPRGGAAEKDELLYILSLRTELLSLAYGLWTQEGRKKTLTPLCVPCFVYVGPLPSLPAVPVVLVRAGGGRRELWLCLFSLGGGGGTPVRAGEHRGGARGG